MTDEQFDQLVTRIQQRFGSRPWWLRVRIMGMVLVGYAGFLAGLVLVLLVSAGLVIAALTAGTAPGIILMSLVAVLLAFGICQTLVFLWVPLAVEQARDVTKEEVPRLFKVLTMLEEDYGTRPFHSVRITAEFNASVQVIPQWGVFGGNRSYLFIGLPLMHMLTPEQFAAVLAHEFAHSSSRHDRFGVWIYRLRQTWARVFAELHTTSRDSGLNSLRRVVIWFVDWYWPRFNAYAFVLSRADEYQADRIAAEWGGTAAMGEALWRIECLWRRMTDDFWNVLTQLAKTREDVPDDFVARMTSFFEQPPTPHDANRWIDKSAQALTGSVDTHPSLSDRLRALGLDFGQFARQGFPRPPVESAADALLGSAQQRIADDVNALWKKDNLLRWQNLFHQAKRLEKKLSSTAPAVEAEMLTAEQQWEHARTVGQLQGNAAAEPLLRQLLDRYPMHGPANIALGCHLLERGHGEGEQFLRRILNDEEHEMVPAACDVLANYFQQSGQSEKVRDIRAIVSRYHEAQAAGMKERSTVTVYDRFVAHELSDEELQILLASLTTQPSIDAAWLVRKDLKHLQKQRLFVMVVRTKVKGVFGRSNPDLDRYLVTSLMSAVKLPGRVLIIAPHGGFSPLAKKVMAMGDSKVFPVGH